MALVLGDGAERGHVVQAPGQHDEDATTARCRRQHTLPVHDIARTRLEALPLVPKPQVIAGSLAPRSIGTLRVDGLAAERVAHSFVPAREALHCVAKVGDEPLVSGAQNVVFVHASVLISARQPFEHRVHNVPQLAEARKEDLAAVEARAAVLTLCVRLLTVVCRDKIAHRRQNWSVCMLVQMGAGQSFDKFFSKCRRPRPREKLSANLGPRRPFGRSQKFPQILLFSSPTETSPAYPSLRGYRRAETADGPRRQQSVIHMRAQMLRSLFLARHGEGGAGWGVALANSSLESLWTTGHHPQMHRQLRAGRRVCRRELLEASAQRTAFSLDERERLPLLSGAFTYRGCRQRGCSAGVWAEQNCIRMLHWSFLKATTGTGAMAASALRE